MSVFAAIGDGIAGLSSVGALAAAAIAAVFSVRSYRADQRREEREQAALISAWCASRRKDSGADRRSARGLIVRNLAPAPAFEVTVESSYAQKAREDPVALRPLRIAVLPPGEFYVEEQERGWSFPELVSDLAVPPKPVMNNPGWTVTALEFTDAQGTVWRRDGRGRLESLGRAS
ncbi:hypothetical protein [Microbacterium sp. ZXX196]|uniref:hypothetical protein n=1 Tax=Microbacterium sp. ZXX196 TaxID=2609291 RepID=UPI0012B902FC|nr:hypothetical protein [Microbacterium sp. ZXX196]MTE24886.1 hypothetical protein [Microbacterium sp. ZXX196]